MKEDREFEDDEGLLNFAAGLDFDRYIDDLEVRTMMEKVRKRIMDLEREVTQDERRVAESEARAKLRALNGEVGYIYSCLLFMVTTLFYIINYVPPHSCRLMPAPTMTVMTRPWTLRRRSRKQPSQRPEHF